MDRNFVGVRYSPEIDRSLFLDDDVLEALDPAWTNLAQLLAHIKMFPSVTQAKKNGFDKPMPLGWFQMRLPKRMFGMLTIWNPTVASVPDTEADREEARQEQRDFDAWNKTVMTKDIKRLCDALNALDSLEIHDSQALRRLKTEAVERETDPSVRDFGFGWIRFQ